METNDDDKLSRVGEILKILGEDTVLLKVGTGEQVPTTKDWIHTPKARMQDPEYLRGLESGNIGVLLGKPSGNLVTINIDDDHAFGKFLKINIFYSQNTFITKGKRGGNIWFRLIGKLPASGTIKDSEGKLIGELRGDGRQTIISGIHPSGCEYQFINKEPPLEIRFKQLGWPKEWQLQWEEKANQYKSLIELHGEPYVPSSSGKTIKLNQRCLAAKFASENNVIYEPELGKFYEYQQENGLWIRKSEARVKKDLGDSLKCFADEVGQEKIIYLATEPLLRALAQLLKGEAEKRSIFENRPKQIIHLENCMLSLDSSPPDILSFNPSFYSRNQSPIPYDPKADCQMFKTELLGEALAQEDIDLLQRYCGQCLLGINLSQRLLILSGTAGGGKSTVVTVIEKIIGTENVAELRVSNLDGRFETSRYIDRSLLVSKDVPSNFLNQSSAYKIKALIGGDLQEAERKNANDTYKFYGNFNVIITSNTRLKVMLDSDIEAWRRRLLIVHYKNPKPEKPIVQFADILIKNEGSGIINWMIEGAIKVLNELDTKGVFMITDVQKERVDDLLDESDSLLSFVKRKIVRKDDSVLTTEEIVNRYKNFCDEKGWISLTNREAQEKLVIIMKEVHGVVRRTDIHKGTSITNQRGYSKVGFVD